MLFHRQCLYTKDKHFTHFGWCFCGILVGVFAVEYWVGIVEKFVGFRFFFIIRLIEKCFTFFLPNIYGFFTLFLPNIEVEITLFLPNVRGCGGVSFDEGMGEMGGVSGGNGFFRCFVVVKIGCE